MHQRAICHDAIEFLHNYLSPGTGLPCLISSARTASARSCNRALFLAACSSLTNADGRGFAPLLPGGECPLLAFFNICCTLPISSRMTCAPIVDLRLQRATTGLECLFFWRWLFLGGFWQRGLEGLLACTIVGFLNNHSYTCHEGILKCLFVLREIRLRRLHVRRDVCVSNITILFFFSVFL